MRQRSSTPNDTLETPAPAGAPASVDAPAPRLRVTPQVEPPTPDEAQPTSAVNILVVDDHPDNRLAIRAILNSPEYHIVEAATGSEALRCLLREDFALVLLDVVMPGMDGLEVASVIKQRDRTRGLPIIFLTAQGGDLDAIFRGYTAGAVDYLVKPVSPEVVRAKVAVFAELFRQREAIRRSAARLRAAEQRARELELAEFKTSLDTVADAVWIFDARDWRVLYANQGAAALLGAPPEALAQVTPLAFLPEFSAETLRATLAPLQQAAGQSGGRGPGPAAATRLETRVRRADGALVPVEVSLQYIPTDGERFVAIARDITERARAEAERARLYDDAQAAIRARDEFLSIASHELRTPLAALQLQVESVLRPDRQTGARMVSDRAAQRLEAVSRQVVRLSRLVEQLLDVSRIGAGKLELEREDVDLAAVARDVAARFAEELAHTGTALELHADAPAEGCWDRMRLEQVITNLLSNAIKYGAGKPVTLEIRVEAGGAVLVVRDQGIGVPAEHLDKIFDRFERAVSERNYGGLGLGLFIVRQLVTAHGGSVHAESRPGAGSTFTVRLPRDTASA